MKILIIHNKYGKFSGEEAVVEAQIKLLTKNGHQVSTYFRSSEELETMPNAKTKAFFSGFKNRKAIHAIIKQIKNNKPDVVHIHNLYPLISPAILPEIKKLGIPIVMTVHNYRLLCPNGLFFTNGNVCEKCTTKTKEINCIINNCEGSILKSTGYALRNFWARKKEYYIDNVDLFLCLTAFQKSKLVANQFPESKCMVIPNFYSKSIKNITYNLTDRNYVAFAGRVSPEKGIPILLAAAQKLPGISFQIAGQIRAGYKKELKIPKNVIFRGMLTKDEMEGFYKKARLYVHTSICYEGFPMVFPEAMAYKLPIIAPNLAGYPEIARQDINGLLFKPKDSQDLATKIKNLWNDEKKIKLLAQNGYNIVKNNYSNTVYYKQLKLAYNTVTTPNPTYYESKKTNRT